MKKPGRLLAVLLLFTLSTAVALTSDGLEVYLQKQLLNGDVRLSSTGRKRPSSILHESPSSPSLRVCVPFLPAKRQTHSNPPPLCISLLV